MTGRQRLLRFGGSALTILVGLVVTTAGTDIVLEAFGIFLMLVGFLVALMLIYLEVGLSEDRDRDQ